MSDMGDIMVWVLRFAWILLVVQWVDIVVQTIPLLRPLLPAGTKLTRDGANAAAAALPARGTLARRARALLESYGRGWDTRAVVDLLAHQNTRETYRLCATGLFVLLVFVACVRQSDQPSLAWLGIAALGATLFAKGLVLGRTDSVLETEIVSKLPGTETGISGASASEIAAALAPAIENAFRASAPQPEAFAAAIKASIASAATSLDTASGKLGASIQEGADKLKAALSSQVQGIEKASSTSLEQTRAVLAAQVQSIEKASLASHEQTRNALVAHADKIAKVSQELSASLEKVTAIGKDIEKVLHVSQSVDGALKGVAGSDEFRKTLASLQSHLADSDKLLREVSRPRKIRLVEGEG